MTFGLISNLEKICNYKALPVSIAQIPTMNLPEHLLHLSVIQHSSVYTYTYPLSLFWVIWQRTSGRIIHHFKIPQCLFSQNKDSLCSTASQSGSQNGYRSAIQSTDPVPPPPALFHRLSPKHFLSFAAQILQRNARCIYLCLFSLLWSGIFNSSVRTEGDPTLHLPRVPRPYSSQAFSSSLAKCPRNAAVLLFLFVIDKYLVESIPVLLLIKLPPTALSLHW